MSHLNLWHLTSQAFAELFAKSITVFVKIPVPLPKRRKTFDKYVRGSPFHVDQFVWLYWPRPPVRQQKRKLQRLWSGPWRILKFQSSLVVIQNLKTNKHQTVHVDRLAPCRSQQREQRDPSDIGVESMMLQQLRALALNTKIQSHPKFSNILQPTESTSVFTIARFQTSLV